MTTKKLLCPDLGSSDPDLKVIFPKQGAWYWDGD